MAEYSLFRADLFTAEFNYENTACLISDKDDELNIIGTFRTNSDLVGLVWNSKDRFKHDYCKYPLRKDLRGVKLRFKLDVTGDISDFSDLGSKPAIAITDSLGVTRYASLGFLSSTKTCTEVVPEKTVPFEWTTPDGEKCVSSQIPLSHKWVKWGSAFVNKGKPNQVPINDMNYPYGYLYVSDDIDYMNTIVGQEITYEYSDFEEIIIDFDRLYTALSPNGMGTVKYSNGATADRPCQQIKVDDVKRLLFPFVPLDWADHEYKMYGEDIKHYNIHIKDIKVENGFLGYENDDLPIHGYRICEGYDDEFVTCPRRLTREMRKLGYAGITVLYIGASHFYEKWGTKGEKVNWIPDVIVHDQMVLDPKQGCTPAFKEWYRSYCKWLKVNGTNNIVCSISLENLQMPDDWKQRLYDGSIGLTGWTPATSFYSLTNPDVRTYIDKIARECLDIQVSEGMPPILQLGEAWWWWQEYVPENVRADGTLQGLKYPNQPPAFYDDYTKQKFKMEMGYDIPEYKTTHLSENELDKEALNWINKQLCDYSNFMKDIVKSYPNGKYTVLYFPPYILDKERVSPMMRIVNTPFNAWKDNQLDFIELEDYDWVTDDNYHHNEIYTFAKDNLGYDVSKQHYFSGFCLFDYNAEHDWNLIKRAGRIAKGQGIGEVFYWSGSQVRRDNIYADTDIQSMATNWQNINFIG